jgi:hypothetical protein
MQTSDIMTEHSAHDLWIEKITQALRSLRRDFRQDGDTTATRSSRAGSEEGSQRDAPR